MKDGVWIALAGASWEKGNCVIEFERHCDDGFDETSRVQDTDAVRLELRFDPVISSLLLSKYFL